MIERDERRAEFLAEIKRMQDAMHRTHSQYLRRDYRIAIKEMTKELAEYDAYHKQAK